MPHPLTKYRHGATPYAFVTGATDGLFYRPVSSQLVLTTRYFPGIGNALANELAVQGFNLVIHGRNAEKLAKVQSELQAAHARVDIVIICADASQRIEDWATLLSPLKELHITVLINNVGNSQTAAYFPVDHISDEDIYTLIHTNDIFPTLVTKHMLPKLIANAPSLILNIGSVAGTFGVPLLSVYSGTKAYNISFARAVRNDLRLLGHDNVECKAVFVVRPLSLLQPNLLDSHCLFIKANVSTNRNIVRTPPVPSLGTPGESTEY
jgi:17beta-estradiol 17-dehydrogenase / very-long-chain 3-oxoacyl-CoA reductase